MPDITYNKHQGNPASNDAVIQRTFAFGEDIQARFEKFHADNPRVYAELVSLARRAKSTGRRKYSIEVLFALLRWNREIETKGDDFKLNDHFTSRYARLIMQQERDLAGFFEIRRLAA